MIKLNSNLITENFIVLSFCIMIVSCNSRGKIDEVNSIGETQDKNIQSKIADTTIQPKIPYSIQVLGIVEPYSGSPGTAFRKTNQSEFLIKVENVKDTTIFHMLAKNFKVQAKNMKEYPLKYFGIYGASHVDGEISGKGARKTTHVLEDGIQTQHYNCNDSNFTWFRVVPTSKLYMGLRFEVLPQDVQALYWFDYKINEDSMFTQELSVKSIVNNIVK